MKNIKKYVTMAVAGVMMLSFAGCNIVERTPETIQKTVYAKVGSKKITKADVDEKLKSYLDRYKQQYGDDFETNDQLKDSLKEMRKQALDMLIDEEVLMQSKESLGVNPTDDEIQEEADKEIQEIKDGMGSDEQFQSALENYGYTNESFEEYCKKQIVQKMINDKLIDEIAGKYYEENKDEYKGKAAEVTHILFMPEKDAEGKATDEADAKAKSLAEAAKAQADAGKSLKEISESDEFKDAARYEELGRVPFENSKMVKEFEDAFTALPANKVSDVVKTDYGYHVIVNTAVYGEDDIRPLDEKLKYEIVQEKQDLYETKMDELKDKVKVKKYEDRI